MFKKINKATHRECDKSILGHKKCDKNIKLKKNIYNIK